MNLGAQIDTSQKAYFLLNGKNTEREEKDPLADMLKDLTKINEDSSLSNEQKRQQINDYMGQVERQYKK